MKKILVILLVVVVAAVSAWWYFIKRDKTDQLTLIPKDAVIVAGINIQSIYDKMNWEKMKEFSSIKEILKGMKSESNKSALQILDNPLSSGIDIAAEPYVYLKGNEQKGKEMGVVFRILNSESFKGNVEKISKKKSTVLNETTGLNYIKIDENSILAWDNEKGMVLNESRPSPEFKMNEDGSYEMEEQEGVTIDVTKRISTLFAMKADENILSNDEFNDSRKKEHDLCMYMNYENYAELFLNNKMMGDLPKEFKEMYNGMAVGGRLLFEDNRIAMYSQSYFKTDAIRDKMKWVSTDGLNEDHLAQITNKDVYMLFSASIDLSKLLANMTHIKLYRDGLDKIAAMLGIKGEELQNLLTGDMSMAFIDCKMKQVERMSYEYDPETMEDKPTLKSENEPFPVITAALGLKDKAKFSDILKKMGIMKTGGMWIIPTGPSFTVYIAENKSGITLSNDSLITAQVTSKQKIGDLPKGIVRELATENPIAFYMSLELDKYPMPVKEYLRKSIGPGYVTATNFLKSFKDIRSSGNMEKAEVFINMTDGDGSNALFRIFSAVDKVAAK